MAREKHKTTGGNGDTVKFRSIYNFMSGRNLFTIRLCDIKKVTLLKHKILTNKDDKVDVTTTYYILSVTGDQLDSSFKEPDNYGNDQPMYDTLLELKVDEAEYTSLYLIYEDLLSVWDRFLVN